MDDSEINSGQTPPPLDKSDKLSRLTSALRPQTEFDRSYSKTVRLIRTLLPIAAVAMIAIVFTWSQKPDERVISIKPGEKAPPTIGKNELVNPRFESMDNKRQPYTITADRAVQGEENEELIILEHPKGDLMTRKGNWIAIEAQTGAYRQDTQRLLLKGDVKLFHDLGYQLETQQLNIDINNAAAWSDQKVTGQGPSGTIEASGLEAKDQEGHLVFTGPAKLILNKSFKL